MELLANGAESRFRLALQPALLEQLRLFAEDVDFHLQTAVTENPALLDFAKWSAVLPLHYQGEILTERYVDVDGARAVLRGTVVMLADADPTP